MEEEPVEETMVKAPDDATPTDAGKETAERPAEAEAEAHVEAGEAAEPGPEDVDADGGIMSEDDADASDFEATVPEEWQRVMSTRTLREGTPLPLEELLEAIGAVIEGKVKADAADPASRVSVPTYTWQWASTTHGSHKLAEVGLANIVKGVEKFWTSNAAVRFFGELNGMLKDPHNDAVNRKLLSLLAGETALCDADAIAHVLADGGDASAVAADNARAAFANLNLPETEMEKLETMVEGEALSLAALLQAAVQPVRDALADAAEGGAIEVGEEVGTDEPAHDDSAAAEAVLDNEAARANANADRVSAALDWATIVAKLPIGATDKDARSALFDSCTSAALMDRETAKAGLFAHLKASKAAEAVLSPAIDSGFALVAEIGSRASTPHDAVPNTIGRWGFMLLMVHVRHFVELLMTLDRLTADEAAGAVSEDEFRTVCGKVTGWGVPIDDAATAYEALAQSGEVSFESLCGWCLRASVEVIAGNGADAAVEEAAAVALLPPAEPLEPVMEQTEDSFGQSGLGLVRKGFFDGSQLDSTAEGESLQAKYAAAVEELEQLRREKAAHEKKMGTVLDANATMQEQLKELNMVVEGVVKRELQRVKASKSGGRGRSPTKFAR